MSIRSGTKDEVFGEGIVPEDYSNTDEMDEDVVSISDVVDLISALISYIATLFVIALVVISIWEYFG